jgi:hypothetical protein
MNMKHWFAFGLAAVLIVGCTGKVEQSADSAAPSPAPVASAPATAPASPDLAQATQTVEKSGTFVSGEHPTQGTVRLVTQNGQSSIELGQDFETFDMGPDLVVILHRSDNVIGSTEPPAYSLNEGDYVVIAPLQQFEGAQSYPIPSNVNVAEYRSAGIWCRQFNATFGAAVLNP